MTQEMFKVAVELALERLRTACEQMHTRALKRPRNPGPLARNLSGVAGRAGRVEGDTFASASSYSAALCAALAACKAVDAVCRGDAANAFAAAGEGKLKLPKISELQNRCRSESLCN